MTTAIRDLMFCASGVHCNLDETLHFRFFYKSRLFYDTMKNKDDVFFLYFILNKKLILPHFILLKGMYCFSTDLHIS